jgi:hypothetical protein
MIKFQAANNCKSFTINKLPVICGSESRKKWNKLIKKSTPEELVTNGHSVMSTSNWDALPHDELSLVETKLSFTKATDVVNKHHFALKQEKGLTYVLVLAPMMINKVSVEPSSTWIEVKQNDSVFFPGPDNEKPYVYHIELISESEEKCLNFNVL